MTPDKCKYNFFKNFTRFHILSLLLFLGFMFDAFGTYNEGFILMGIMIALSGLMLYPIPCIQNMLRKVS